MMKNSSFFYVLIINLASLLLALLIGFSFFYIIQNYQAPIQESTARVQTIFGCVPVLDTNAQFEAKQDFTHNVLGFELVRCG